MSAELTVRDRVNAGEYENKLDWPDFTKTPYLVRIEELKAEIEALAAQNKLWTREQRGIYGAETARLADKFRADLEAEHGMTGHPKAGALWNKAYEDGRSYGYSEIVNCYENLVELVK